MKILILSQYYPPEIGACANRIDYMARFLAKSGHDVTVLTAAPNYPEGVIYDGYKNRFQKEKKDGVTVVRVPVILSKKKGMVGRLAYYLSYVMNGIRQAKKMPAPDILWATSPPLFTAMLALKLKKIFKAPLVMDIRDIWPASIRDVGAVRNRTILKIAERLAQKTYNNSDAITVTSKGIKDGLPPEALDKVTIIPNGVDSKLFIGKKGANPFPPELRGKFIVLYTGNLGLAQAPETMIEAAELLCEEENIHFVFVGFGVLEAKMHKLAEEKKLSNILFEGAQPQKKMPNYIAYSNVCLIPYKAQETFHHTLPSKLFDYMAGGKPVIINLQGEAADIIKKAKCGFVAKDEDSKDLAKYIKYFADDPKVGEDMGVVGRKYVMQHFKRETIAKKLEEVIMHV